MIARLAVAAALVGSAVGAAVVLADEPAPTPRPAVPAVKTVVPPAQPTPEPIEARDPRVVLEVPDPKGAAAWAIRQFDTTFTSRKGKQTPGTCYDVGRVQDGTFGWIGADGTFKATEPGRGQTPGDCPSAKVLDAIEAVVYRYATVTTPPGGSPQPDRSITWGVAQPQIAEIVLPDEPPIVPRGGLFLRLETGRMPAAPLQRTLQRSDGTRRHIDELKRGGFRGEVPAPETRTLAAVAPDPAGGRPWGLIIGRSRRGETCLSSPEQLVGDAYAYIDSRLGIAFAGGIGGFFNCKRKPPTRAFPMRTETLISGIADPDPRGRIERRVVEGRIVFSGTVHPDVVSITITTPHDVRTLIPTPEHHAFVTVYAGRFPGGEATATARFKDGRTVTRSLYVE
ncbi:hypothetical protein OJ998_14175 [Solirubrobacter taibaiensis]|nr:hypothetical protein [Solirubrobacter taibaiensis]